MTHSQSQILLMTFPHLLLRLLPQKSNFQKKKNSMSCFIRKYSFFHNAISMNYLLIIY